MPGVVRTRVGYAGGATRNPYYRDLGDHSETLQIDFDPSRISYKKLLDIFWKGHDETRDSWFRRYRAAIFYHNEEQRKLAMATRYHIAPEKKQRVLTAIEPYSGFNIAEDYHQKHSLRSYPEIMKEFSAIYPDIKSLIDSSAVARVNGYLGGYGL